MQINEEQKNLWQEIDWNNLLRKDFGDFGNLTIAQVNFDRIKKIIDDFIESDNDYPDQLINLINNKINEFIQITERIKTEYTDTAKKEEFIFRIKEFENKLITEIAPYSFYIQENTGTIKRRNRKIATEQKKLESTLNRLKSKTEQVISEAKKTISDGEARVFSEHFEKQSESHKKQAKKNWVLAIIFVVVTFLYSFIFILSEASIEMQTNIYSINSILTYIQNSNIFAHIVIIGIFSIVIRTSFKDYYAEKNLENVYMQKHLALKSHNQMIESVQSTKTENDLQTLNTLLSHLSQSIFEVRESGFIQNRNNTIDINNPLSPGLLKNRTEN